MFCHLLIKGVKISPHQILILLTFLCDKVTVRLFGNIKITNLARLLPCLELWDLEEIEVEKDRLTPMAFRPYMPLGL